MSCRPSPEVTRIVSPPQKSSSFFVPPAVPRELGLVRPADLHVERGAVAEVALDHLRRRVQVDADLA